MFIFYLIYLNFIKNWARKCLFFIYITLRLYVVHLNKFRLYNLIKNFLKTGLENVYFLFNLFKNFLKTE